MYSIEYLWETSGLIDDGGILIVSPENRINIVICLHLLTLFVCYGFNPFCCLVLL